MITNFHIYGDNIIECERTLFIIQKSLNLKESKIKGPFNSAFTPTFEIEIGSDKYSFIFFPGFGRWNLDILNLIRENGGLLREATDAVISRVENGSEKIILSIEYCSALPAGNQAWQRSGRAYSFPRAGVPFLYIAEIGGFELNELREKKAARLPNPAIPFSYVSYSFYAPAPVIPVYTANIGSDPKLLGFSSDILEEKSAHDLIKLLIMGRDFSKILESIQDRVVKLVATLASSRKSGSSLSSEHWEEIQTELKKGGSLLKYLLKIDPISWSKTAYIDGLTSSAKETMEAAKKLAWGLTSSNLPICFFPPKNRLDFSNILLGIYPNLSNKFIEWMRKGEPLVVCWIMGFKPRGDDARPDRGLLPLARMLVGEEADILTFIYGPAKSFMWKLLNNDPGSLIEKNGLWEAILLLSNAILVDSSTDDNFTQKGYLKNHWNSYSPSINRHVGLTNPVPLNFSEHDVDTVMHLLFKFKLGSSVFEGMCNPPGGDWSGVSILNNNRSIEYRWLSLPRVSRSGSKRPDHVIQIFDISDIPILLCIESKDFFSNLEESIGPRLITYAQDLFGTSPNAYRSINGEIGKWYNFNSTFSPPFIQYASAIAFLVRKDIEVENAAQICQSDLVIGVELGKKYNVANIKLLGVSDIGKSICNFILEKSSWDLIKVGS